MHPRLLSTLVLIEPVIQREFPPELNLAAMSTFRPDLWLSRTAAEATFRKSRFFEPWDSRALDKYLKYGLREVPTAVYPPSQSSEGAVTLGTTKHQEVWTYLRPNFEPQGPKGHPSSSDHLLSPDLDPEVEGTYLFHRPEPAIILNLLPLLRPSALYMFGGKSVLSGSAAQAQKMECTGVGIGGSGGAQMGRVKKVVFENAGHMLPCEDVAGCAEAVATWLAAELERFKAEEEFWAHHDSGKSERDMLIVSRKWQQLIRLPPNSQRPVKEKL